MARKTQWLAPNAFPRVSDREPRYALTIVSLKLPVDAFIDRRDGQTGCTDRATPTHGARRQYDHARQHAPREGAEEVRVLDQGGYQGRRRDRHIRPVSRR